MNTTAQLALLKCIAQNAIGKNIRDLDSELVPIKFHWNGRGEYATTEDTITSAKVFLPTPDMWEHGVPTLPSIEVVSVHGGAVFTTLLQLK